MTKQYPIIYTSDNILLVDDSVGILSGEYAYDRISSSVQKAVGHLHKGEFNTVKIIASTVKISTLPQFRIEDDVIALVEREFPFLNEENDLTGEIEEENRQLKAHRYSFIKGYRSAQAKKYTEEDMLKAIQYGKTIDKDDNLLYGKEYTAFMQSLQLKYKAAEIIMEEVVKVANGSALLSGKIDKVEYVDAGIRPLVKDGFITIKRFIP